MATVAEALIIKLGLDAKDVRKGGQETEESLKKVENQANKTGKELEKTSKQGKEFFSSLEAGLLSLIAAVGAARVVKSFFDDAIKGMAALGRQSEYLHTSASTLQAWGNVVESVGGDAREAGNSLQALASDFINLKVTGQSSFAPVLNRLGIDMRQFKNSADPLTDLVLSISEKLKGLSPQEALFFGKKLGFSDSFITALRQGSASVADLLDQFRRASGATDENTKAAQRAQQAWTLIQARFTGIRDELEGKLTPVVQRLLERFADWIDKNKELITSRIIEWIQQFARWISSIDWDGVGRGVTRLLQNVIRLVEILGKGVDAIGGWKNAFIGLGALLTLNMLSPLTSIVGMLGRMVPLLVSARAGLVGLAAAAGYFVGTKISEQLEGTKAGDVIGEGVTRVLAAFGNDEAQQSLERNLYTQGTDADKGKLRANYLMMSASQKAQYETDHPALASAIKTSLVGQRASEASSDRSYYAQHSRIFGNPDELFASLEKREGLPTGSLNAVFQQESAGGKHLVSPAGAKGPFQIMDALAKDYGLSGEDVFDLDKSAALAARQLHKLRDQFGGDFSLALAGYNAGPGNVQKYGGIPPFAETQKYVSSVNSRLGMVNGGYGSVDNSKQSDVSIGTINVNAPQATDARGIAMQLPGELRRNGLLAQATTGLQ